MSHASDPRHRGFTQSADRRALVKLQALALGIQSAVYNKSKALKQATFQLLPTVRHTSMPAIGRQNAPRIQIFIELALSARFSLWIAASDYAGAFLCRDR